MKPALLALAACAALAAPAAAQELKVTGLDGQVKVLKLAELSSLPRGSATLTEDGKPHVYEGPLAAAVLRAAGAPMGSRLHGDPLKAYAVVRGADGFFAVYSLAELDRDFHDDPVVLADTVDGAPLADKQRPWRLVSGGDRKGWRAVYAVSAIELKPVR